MLKINGKKEMYDECLNRGCNVDVCFQGDKSVRVMRSLLASQQTFVDRLVQLMKAVQRESGNRKKKVRSIILYQFLQLLEIFFFFF